MLTRLRESDLWRMAGWLAAGMLLNAASLWIGERDPLLQVILWKSGRITLLAWVGYWISRQALGRLDRDKPQPQLALARAVIIAGVVIAGGGL